MEQRAHGFAVWEEPFVTLRVPKLFTLRGDPFERADHEGIDYPRWRAERIFLLVPASAFVARWLEQLQGVPAAAEAGELQHRPGDGEAFRARGRRQVGPRTSKGTEMAARGTPR